MEKNDLLTRLREHIRTDYFLQLKNELESTLVAAEKKGILGKLTSVVGYKPSGNRLNRQNAELGLLLINELPAYKSEKNYGSQQLDTVGYKTKRYNRIEELLGEKEWDDPVNYNLLVYLFGNEKAAYARHAWTRIPYQMYQTGYTRRSFRSPANREMYLGNQINFIIQLIPQSYSQQYDSKYNLLFTCYDLPVTQQVKYNHAIGDNNTALFRLWAAAIDMDNTGLFNQLEDIIFNKDEEGKITRSIIKALLNSDRKEAWVLVEKLLLSLQRQEGLRQTILEALDETSIGGLKYIIRVIVDNQLTRFSSVVRSVDVWAGLGWESERETTVRNFLEKAMLYLENPAIIPDAIKGDNNADIYMALWAQGVYDVEQTIPLLQQLAESGSVQKRTLALLFCSQSAHYKLQMPFYIQALADAELQPLGCAAGFICHALSLGENNKIYDQQYPDLFNRLQEVYRRTTVKEKIFEAFVFSWIKITFQKKELLQAMLHLVMDRQDRLDILLSYFDDMDAAVRRQLSRVILPKHAAWDYKPHAAKQEPLTAFQRRYAMIILKDRTEYDVACNALYNIILEEKEMGIFPDLLKRKSAEFRNKIIALLLKQRDKALIPVLDEVLQGDVEQRLAGLDILLQLKKAGRLVQESGKWLSAFSERKNISTKEEILLSQLSGEEDIVNITADNGYGLFNPENKTEVALPPVDPDNIYEKLFARNRFGFSKPFDKIKEALNDLGAIVLQHKDYEYEIEYWNGQKAKVLLGNQFNARFNKNDWESPEEQYKAYPLHEHWESWYTRWNLQPQDLFIIGLSVYKDTSVYGKAIKAYLPFYDDFLPAGFSDKYNYHNPLPAICKALYLIHPFDQANEFCIGAATRLFASLGREVLQSVNDNYNYLHRGDGWQGSNMVNAFLNAINILTLEDKYVPACWGLYNWRQYNGLSQNVAESIPPLEVFCRARQLNIITEDEMYRGMLTATNIGTLSQKVKHPYDFNYYKFFPFLESMFERARNHVLDMELKRGDSPTPVTVFAASLKTIYGVHRFSSIIAGLGKTSLYKGYISSWGNSEKNKQELFSWLLKNCFPQETDTQVIFNENMEKIKVTNTRLIDAAVYAPQWQPFISNYLGWKGLDTAIWWMHAHTKTDGYRAQSAEAESEIAKYSSLDVEEFKDGAVDKEWFHRAYKEIGKERWPMVYDAAKYISDGNGHRRARIYADVLLGNLKIKEVEEKIKTKRDQDYLRIYGLVPLNKTNTANDVLGRYEYLQQFKKESRQFGAMKQTSEGVAIRVAMENLARNANYADPLRLTWSMETKQVQEILSKETQVQYDDVLIGLIIDDEGETDVVAFKDDKPLKAIPAKYKKDKKVEELAGYKKTLREQFRRSRKGLEDAMVRGDLFAMAEIKNLFAHPVIAKHLEKLVFITDGKADDRAHGFYFDGKLKDMNGHETAPGADDKLRVAHCTDLYETGQWAAYQRYAFDKRLQQPFKQIYRELYLPTEDERSEKSVSRRYAGHQIQPKQTVALLKSRGWKVNYEEGLQKVFHKEGFAAMMYAMADWFSPADVESPTLETVQFQELKTGKSVAFESIHPRIFSEVMRDMDLVVSIAHVGGVDPEASHSSIEMRAALLRETMRLFRIDNAEIKGSHVIIKGNVGEYSVHIGSAVVHQMAKGYLSILPVHSQHRGRLFLPFVDDDPKSAEVISKVLLLARDHEIQDPTILQQLS